MVFHSDITQPQTTQAKLYKLEYINSKILGREKNNTLRGQTPNGMKKIWKSIHQKRDQYLEYIKEIKNLKEKIM